MRHQISQRSRKSPVIVDEDCGIPTSVIDSYREDYEPGPFGPADPRTLSLSMSDYKQPQSFDVYDYSPATRPEQAQDYSGFAANPAYGSDYVGAQAQVPSGLPQSTGLNMLPSAHQTYGTHDPTYYGQQQSQYPAYLDTEPRQLPEVISYSPASGQQGTKVTVHFRTAYNLDNPSTSIVMMFGQQRCSSVLSKTSHQGPPYEYALTAEAPSLSSTDSSSPQLPLNLMFEGSPSWASPSLEFGMFSFLDEFPIDSPTQQQSNQRKRKLTPDADERRSPVKKQSYAALPPSTRADSHSYFPGAQPAISVSTDYSRSTMADAYARRFSVPEPAYGHTLPRVSAQQQYYGAQPASAAARMQSTQNPSYNYYSSLPNTTRSPAMQAISAGGRSSMVPTPSGGSNPPLIRTSTITQSPSTPGAQGQSFNPYAMYPGNQKAILKLEGDLNSMVDNFTPEEWEVKRRLVQFRRSQQGATITATFEPVSPEERAPNSICVSCIYWAEKSECYVTSVDTIQLLEALVAVRFTVEEKNRIRRNLEGFRPATVSKAKQDSEEFFKLIMGFPNPKPRNIEKDVKVFPWRILATALKKIIGKYSASYSSTAGAMPQQMPGASYSRGSDAGMRQMISPLTTTAPSHAYASAMTSQAYAGGSAGFGPSAGPPDLRLTVPGAGGYQAASHYSSSDLSATSSAGRGNSWDFGTYISASPATGLPGSAQATHYQYGIGAGQPQQQRISSIAAHSAQSMNEGRFLPLYDQEETSQQTSSA